MTTIAAIIAKAPEVNSTAKTEGSKETKKSGEVDVASALSGATKPQEKKPETEQELRTQFEKKAKEQKTSQFRAIASYASSIIAAGIGFEAGVGFVGGILGAGLVGSLLGGIAFGGLLGFGIWNLFKPSDKYENTIIAESQRRMANMIDAKVKQPKGKGIDKSIVDDIPNFYDFEFDPKYNKVAIYNDKSGNPEIVTLNETTKAFNELLEGYSTDEQPDLKADKVSDLTYKAKALFLKSDKSASDKAKMNDAFDEMIKKFTAENSEGGKDLTKSELVAIRHDLRAALFY